jgi:hypothetical protein
MKIELVEQVIELTKKKLKLLEELKESLKYEECKYHLVCHKETSIPRWSLIEIKSKKSVCHGSSSDITRFIKRRNLDSSLIYKSPQTVIQ